MSYDQSLQYNLCDIYIMVVEEICYNWSPVYGGMRISGEKLRTEALSGEE